MSHHRIPAFPRRKIFLNVLAALPALAVVGALSVPGSVMAAMDDIVGVFLGADGTTQANTTTGNANIDSNTAFGANGKQHTIIPLYGSSPVSNGSYVWVKTGYASTSTNIVGGGSFSGGDVTNNTITFDGNGITIDGIVVGGAGKDVVNVTGNTATVKSGTVSMGVNGGLALLTSSSTSNVSVSDNYLYLLGTNVTIGSGTIGVGDSYGGYLVNTLATSGTGTVTSNHVVVEGATIKNNVFGGGIEGYGDVTYNTVSVKDASVGTSATIGGDVVGGVVNVTKNTTTGSSASHNTVTLENSDATARVWGGKIKADGSSATLDGIHADENHVTLTNTSGSTKTVGGTVVGGNVGVGAASYGYTNATAYKNIVEVDSYTLSDSVYGGRVEEGGDANANEVTLAGALDIARNVGGGYVRKNGNATDNKVTINGAGTLGSSSSTYSIFGGRVEGDAASNTANNNTVSITATGDLAIETTLGGAYVGGGTASNNTVTLNGKAGTITVDNDVFGAIVDGDGEASDNTVTLSGNAEVSGEVGGGNVEGDGNANYNTVTLSGNAKVFDDVFGGNVEGDGNANYNTITLSDNVKVSGDVYGGNVEGDGEASHNTINLSGYAEITGDEVVGGYVDNGNATYNTINIGANVILGQSIALRGGDVGGSGAGGNAFTGNTLNLNGWTGKIGSVNGFETYNIQVPTASFDGITPIVTLTGGSAGTDNSDLSGSTINLLFTAAPTDGMKVVTFAAATDIITATDSTGKGTYGAQGFDTTSTKVGNTIVTQLTNLKNDPAVVESAKSYSEGFIAGAVAINSAADMATTQGISALLSSAQNGGQSFGAIGYGDSRYETGSHVNAKGYNLLVGLSAGVGNASVGGFFETGDGDYDTHNSFSSGKVKGSGDLRYHGVGLLGRVDIAGGAYVEASLRAGRTKNDYKNKTLGTKFDTKSDYLGSHVGAGYVWQLNAGQSAEVYGKYLWTHQKGDTVRFDTTANGVSYRSTVKFSATDSQRLRVGGRYTWSNNDRTSFFVGAAYEHEFDGDADAKLTINGVSDKIKSPSLDGNVGIGEIGLKVKPSVNSPVSIEAGLQGYGGDRKGATGYFNLKYVF